MKRFIFSLPVLLLLCLSLTSQDMTFSPPSNLRFDPQANWWQEDDMVKLVFTIRELAPSCLHYYVTCVYEDGESVPSDTLYISLVDIPEIVKGEINVYPNPAKDRVSIDSGNGKIKSVSLINSKGEVVVEKLFTSEKVQLDLSAIPSSFYILRVITEDGVFTSKLLIVN